MRGWATCAIALPIIHWPAAVIENGVHWAPSSYPSFQLHWIFKHWFCPPEMLGWLDEPVQRFRMEGKWLSHFRGVKPLIYLDWQHWFSWHVLKLHGKARKYDFRNQLSIIMLLLFSNFLVSLYILTKVVPFLQGIEPKVLFQHLPKFSP